MHLRQLLNNLLRRDNSVIPAACFNICNAAINEAEKVGLTPELCSADSFQNDYNTCKDCVVANSPNNNGNVSLGALDQYIQYCDSNSTAPISNPALQSSLDAEAAQITSLQAELSTAGHTVTQRVTVSQSAVPGQTGASQTSIPTDAKSTNHAWIAGAVIGPIALLLAIGALVFFLRRRRAQQEKSPLPNEANTDPKEKDKFLQDKAQLHSDHIVRHEMDAGGPPPEPSELPVVERAGEMEQKP